jgi:hypothetical protein
MALIWKIPQFGLGNDTMNARERLQMTDDDITSHFDRFGYRVSIDQIAFVGETVDDFREARKRKWFRAGSLRKNEPGLLVIEDAQPRQGQRTRDIIVISLGPTRIVKGIEIKPGAPPLAPGDAICRYALAMEWPIPEPPKPITAPKMVGSRA